MKKSWIYSLFFTLCIGYATACQCPILEWTKDLANQNDVIMRVKIKYITPHQNNYLVAEVDVLNMFKGNPYKTYKVLFPENDECAIPVNTGEEWLIYGKSKQINSCEIKWCGLSRKKFVNDFEDFFIATHIITYDEELQKLHASFPEIQIKDQSQPYRFHKNIIPEKYELYIYLLISLIVFLLILQLLKKHL